jgi:multiple sugar transport system substrate-binding protein
MKKTCLMLVLALLATMLASMPVALADEPVTITFMGWEASPLETESVLKGIALFESRNPDIKVEYTPINGTYAEKLLTMIAGDAAPTPSSWAWANTATSRKRACSWT